MIGGPKPCPYKGCGKEAAPHKTPSGLAVLTCHNSTHPRIRVVASNRSEAQELWNELVIKLPAYWEVQDFLTNEREEYAETIKSGPGNLSYLHGMDELLIPLESFIREAQVAGDQFEMGQISDTEVEQSRIVKIIEESDWLDPNKDELIKRIKANES